MYLELLAEGKDEIGESDLPPDPPRNFDIEKFERGRKFIHDNVICHVMSMFISLVCGLSVVNLLEPLVFTDKSNTPKRAFKRYESTFMHLAKWFYGNIWDKEDKAHKSIMAVRNLHNHVRTKMTAYEGNGENGDDLEKSENKQDGMSSCPVSRFGVRLSQYDMSLVQCGFIGSIVMYPEKMGMHCTEEELDDFVYFWYGIGHLLGITDKNNICRGGFREARDICKEIEEKVLLPSMADLHPHFHHMAKALIDGSNCVVLFGSFTVESIVACGYHGMNIKLPSLSFLDNCRYLSLRAFLGMLYYCSPVKYVFCQLIRYLFWGNGEVKKIKLP